VKTYLKWEKIKLAFKISFNEKEIVLKNIREQLLSLAGFGWEGSMEAASYCLENDFNFLEALKWIDVSISRNPSFQNKIIKVKLLQKLGEVEKSEEVLKDAIANSTEKELNDYGYQLLNNDKTEAATKIFEENIKRHSKSWNCYDSYANALIRANRKDDALQNYKKALELAPENQKERIKKLIEKK
jgi:tetratricopeptide (TPR) repeat protein